MAELVQVTPGYTYPSLNVSFNKFASGMLSFVDEGSINSLQLAPNGVVQNIYPLTGVYWVCINPI